MSMALGSSRIYFAILLWAARTSFARHSFGPYDTALGRIRGRYLASSVTQRHQVHVEAATSNLDDLPFDSHLLGLPLSCPGCGAFTQHVGPDKPGYYSANRKSVRAFIARNQQEASKGKVSESETFDRVLGSVDRALLSRLGLVGTREQPDNHPKTTLKLNDSSEVSETNVAAQNPVCNRCHNLIHHQTGTPVVHPTVQSIHHIISESPHQYNHVYHILDAADFPLSLMPSLQKLLSLSPQRSMNRRAKSSHFQHGRQAEMSFLITRSDLLAPKKEQVDSLMPYLLQVLRDALGESARNLRLGNVRCVSSKRGWWTKEIKEDIWSRGGGGWMVGKVNVGKSSLLENAFPKGRHGIKESNPSESIDRGSMSIRARDKDTWNGASTVPDLASDRRTVEVSTSDVIEESPLPPAPMESSYPVLPVVSSLPGTTASPIRLPFGNGKGELVDLPGLARGDLGDFVVDQHKSQLVMRTRVKPDQFVIKPGQSLLVGDLIRITPTTPDVIILVYPFVPLKCHVTSTEKAIAIHTQKEESGLPTIAKPGIGSRMDPAGTFTLKWDVTKQRAGPLTKKDAAGLSPDVLPFSVWSVDVLVEGCGWIELVAQVRKKNMESEGRPGDFFDEKPYPKVEISSPDGRHVGIRRPMGAWLLGGQKPVSSGKTTARPRRSMSGVKKQLKKARIEHS